MEDLTAEARNWLSDLTWGDDPDFGAMSDEMIKRGINRFYVGGWTQFVSDGA